MALTEYKVERNGKKYEYAYDRSNYKNNTTEYNKDYWEEHKIELSKKAKLKRIEKNISKIPKETLPMLQQQDYTYEVFVDGDITEIFLYSNKKGDEDDRTTTIFHAKKGKD